MDPIDPMDPMDPEAAIPPGTLVCLLGDDVSALQASLAAVPPGPTGPTGPRRLLCGYGIQHLPLPAGGETVLEILPTPLGRTIGRTWLAAHPLVRGAAWVVFLDAGLVPPPGWLERLVAAARAFPEARSWGCREAADRPGRLGLDPASPPDGADMTRLDAAAFTLAPLAPLASSAQSCGPCLTMPGGCRLFRGDRLREDGGWNLAFAPEAWADVERDLALALRHGRLPCVCLESLVVAPSVPVPPQADPRPNAFKLAHRFSPGELETLATLSRTCHTALPGE